MVYRIPETKPSLKGGGTVDASEEKPALAYDANSDIIMFSEESWLRIVGNWFKTTFMFMLSAVFIFTIMYGILAGSLLFATPVDGKVTLTARDTFLGGVPSPGDIVLSSTSQKAAEGPLERLKEAGLGVDDAQITKILTGPHDSVSFNGDSFAVSGIEPGNYNGILMNSAGERVTKNFQLNNQYVTECMSERCAAGTFIIVDDDKIFGEVVELGKER